MLHITSKESRSAPASAAMIASVAGVTSVASVPGVPRMMMMDQATKKRTKGLSQQCSPATEAQRHVDHRHLKHRQAPSSSLPVSQPELLAAQTTTTQQDLPSSAKVTPSAGQGQPKPKSPHSSMAYSGFGVLIPQDIQPTQPEEEDSRLGDPATYSILDDYVSGALSLSPSFFPPPPPIFSEENQPLIPVTASLPSTYSVIPTTDQAGTQSYHRQQMTVQHNAPSTFDSGPQHAYHLPAWPEQVPGAQANYTQTQSYPQGGVGQSHLIAASSVHNIQPPTVPPWTLAQQFPYQSVQSEQLPLQGNVALPADIFANSAENQGSTHGLTGKLMSDPPNNMQGLQFEASSPRESCPPGAAPQPGTSLHQGLAFPPYANQSAGAPFLANLPMLQQPPRTAATMSYHMVPQPAEITETLRSHNQPPPPPQRPLRPSQHPHPLVNHALPLPAPSTPAPPPPVNTNAPAPTPPPDSVPIEPQNPTESYLWRQLESAQLTTLGTLVDLIMRAKAQNTVDAGRVASRSEVDEARATSVTRKLIDVMTLWHLLRRERGWQG